eukprot:9262101-Alexandrium_andersonii.AAC.1
MHAYCARQSTEHTSTSVHASEHMPLHAAKKLWLPSAVESKPQHNTCDSNAPPPHMRETACCAATIQA